MVAHLKGSRHLYDKHLTPCHPVKNPHLPLEMPQLPTEILMEAAEHLDPIDDLQTILSLRLVSKAVSRAAANVLFRHLDVSVSQDAEDGVGALIEIAQRYGMAVHTMSLGVPPFNANQPEFTIDEVLNLMSVLPFALGKLVRVKELRIILDNDLVEAKNRPGDETAYVMAAVVRSIFYANRSLNKRVIIEARDDIVFGQDHIWGEDNSGFQRWIVELTHYELDTSLLSDDVRNLVNLSDHLGLATDKLKHFKIDQGGESWHVFQSRMVVPALQYELNALVTVDLCNLLCSAPDLRGFLDKSSWCLESLSLSAVLLAGYTKALIGIEVRDFSEGPPLPRIAAPVLASRWSSVFQHLLWNYPKLKHFGYQWLCTQTRFENEWWPRDSTPSTRILPGEAVERCFRLYSSTPIHRKRIPERLDRDDEIALGRLLLACIQRSGAPRTRFTRPEQNMMKSAEYEDMERRVVPMRAAKLEAMEKMAGME